MWGFINFRNIRNTWEIQLWLYFAVAFQRSRYMRTPPKKFYKIGYAWYCLRKEYMNVRVHVEVLFIKLGCMIRCLAHTVLYNLYNYFSRHLAHEQETHVLHHTRCTSHKHHRRRRQKLVYPMMFMAAARNTQVVVRSDQPASLSSMLGVSGSVW